jgi:hypothetical protein
MNVGQDPHYAACMQFADGVALMTRGDFANAYEKLCSAYDLLLELFRDPANADTAHVDLFRTAVALAGAQSEGSAEPNVQAARGMLRAWEACKSSAVGTQFYHRYGGLVPQALAHYQASVSHFEAAISLLEAGLGANHPELSAPLANYSGALRTVGRDAEAEGVFQRVTALPPTELSAYMIGGGYSIIVLDPFGTNPLLPSQTT